MLSTRSSTKSKRVEKPWGHELHWARTEHYCAKVLFVRAGCRLSLQYHDQKVESQMLLNGKASLELEQPGGEIAVIDMEPGEGYTIRPFQRHRLVAVEDSNILEVSTPECGTTVRLEDDYGRGDETERSRLDDVPVA
ncbi:MAG: cupin [Dehalococcoidia bacterium]